VIPAWRITACPAAVVRRLRSVTAVPSTTDSRCRKSLRFFILARRFAISAWNCSSDNDTE
jgi:hypothetical protein